ncbi:MAG: tetratricopeptide repeat protein [Desulfonatronovibrio sp.]
MPKQKTRSKTKNQGSEALQSLLNDQAEARMKKEISISRSKSGTKDQTPSGKSQKKEDAGAARSVPGFAPEDQAGISDLRKPPTMNETKVQLIERMNKILQEIDKLEAGLDQKELERKNAEKDREKMASELQEIRDTKKSLQERIIQKDKMLSSAADNKVRLEHKLQGLETKTRDLKTDIMELEEQVQELASIKEQLDRDGAEKEEEIKRLKQEIQRLQKENQNKEDMTAGRDRESSADHKHTDASAWRTRADELWNGSGYQAPQKALYYLSAALEQRPDWPEVLNDRGLAYLDEGRLDDAIEDFTTAVALKDQFAEAYHNRGVALLRAGKEYAAKKDFQMAAGYGLKDGVNALQSAQTSRDF